MRGGRWKVGEEEGERGGSWRMGVTWGPTSRTMSGLPAQLMWMSRRTTSSGDGTYLQQRQSQASVDQYTRRSE